MARHGQSARSDGENSTGDRSTQTTSPSSSRPVRFGTSLPTEIVYSIAALTLGDFIACLLLRPDEDHRYWGARNAFSSLLHIDATFRACTLKLMGYLWKNELVNARTGAIVNFKPVLTHLRVYSSLSHTEPARLFKDNPHPVTRERSIRRPLVPFVKMAIPILLAGARAKYWLDTPASIRSEHEDFFEECFAMSDYVPAGPPMLLLAEVRVYVLERCYIWSKLKAINDEVEMLAPMIYPISRIMHARTRDEALGAELAGYIRNIMPHHIEYHDHIIHLQSLHARLLAIPQHEVIQPTRYELECSGFFDTVEQLARMLKEDANPPGDKTSDTTNVARTVATRLIRYCLLRLESSLTKEECEVYIKPSFEPGYTWFDVESVTSEE